MALLEDLKEWKEGRCATLYSTPKKKKALKGVLQRSAQALPQKNEMMLLVMRVT